MTLWKQIEKYGKLKYQLNLDHPLLSRFVNGANGREMKDLFEMIEESVPVPLLVSDYLTRRDLMLKPYEAKDTTLDQESIEVVYNIFLAEVKNPQKVMEMLEQMEPYCLFPDELAAFREEKGL